MHAWIYTRILAHLNVYKYPYIYMCVYTSLNPTMYREKEMIEQIGHQGFQMKRILLWQNDGGRAFVGEWSRDVQKLMYHDTIHMHLHMGVSINGGTPIAGWFREKIPNKNRWFGGTPIDGNPHMSNIRVCNIYNRLLPNRICLAVHQGSAHLRGVDSTCPSLGRALCFFIFGNSFAALL